VHRAVAGRACGVLALTLGIGIAAAACGSSGADGSEACQHVEASLHLYSAAATATGAGHSALAASDRQKALTELRLALPLASQAADDNGTWQPLEATLSESNRVDEGHLVGALTAQCADVSS
jgi:hypothetical protein